MDELQDLIIMGVILGKYSGWDQIDTDVLQFFGFEPLPSTGMIAGTLVVNYTTGVLAVYDQDSDTGAHKEYQFLEVLKNMEDARSV